MNETKPSSPDDKPKTIRGYNFSRRVFEELGKQIFIGEKLKNIEDLVGCLDDDPIIDLPSIANKPTRNQVIKAIMKGLEKNKTGFVLDGRTRYLDDDDAVAIADMLKKNATFREVWLHNDANNGDFISNNQIGEQGVQAIATMLKENKSVQILNLSLNKQLTATGIKSLVDVIITGENTTVRWCGLARAYLNGGDQAQDWQVYKQLNDKLQTHLNDIATGKLKQYVQDVGDELPIPKDVSNIILQYCSLDKYKEEEKQVNVSFCGGMRAAFFYDHNLNSMQARMVYRNQNKFDEQYLIPLMTCSILEMIVHITIWLSNRDLYLGTTGSIAFPNAAIISLAVLGFFLICYFGYNYNYEKKNKETSEYLKTYVPEHLKEEKEELVLVGVQPN